MIVKCERCQTRFKIPDEKVTEKGVKVRCTKCQNTFRVAREAAPAEMGAPSAPPASREADPFARFGVAPDPKGVEITKPGYFAQGVEATRAAPAPPPPSMPWNSVDADTEEGVFQEPTRIGPIPLPPAARPSPEAGLAGGAVAPPPGASGLYGSAVPPGQAAGMSPLEGAVPLPGVAGSSGTSAGAPGVAGPRGASVPLPGVAGPRGASVPGMTAGSGAPVPLPGGAGSGSAFAGAPGMAGPRGASAGAPVPLPGVAGPRGTSAPSPGIASASGPGAAVPLPGMASGPGAPVPLPGAAGPRSAPPPFAAPVQVPSTPVFGSMDPAAVPPPVPDAPARAAPAPVTMFGPPKQGAPPPAGAPPARRPAPAAAGADPFAEFLGGSGPSAPPPMPGLDDLPVPAAPAAEALRRAATVPPPAAAPAGAVALGPVRPAAPPPVSAFDAFAGEDPFASIDVDVSASPPPAAPPPAAAAPPPGEDPFASIDIDDATVTAAPPAPAPKPAPLPPPPAANDLFDMGADPFGEHAGMQPTDTGRAALLGAPPPDSESLDLGLDSGGPSLLGDVPPVEEAQEFKVTLGKVGAPATGQREVLDVAAVPKPTARPEDVGIPQRRANSGALKVLAFAANLLVAAALVVGLGVVGRAWLREGKVDLSTLSAEGLGSLVSPQARPLVAVDVSNGLYETREGRPLFFVRGDAENRTGAATRVRVRAALYDGAQRVRSAEALAGALATPEDLYAVGSSEAAEALRQRLDAAATPVAPGAKVPFLILFPEYPADLAGFRLEVTLEPAEAGPRAE